MSEVVTFGEAVDALEIELTGDAARMLVMLLRSQDDFYRSGEQTIFTTTDLLREALKPALAILHKAIARYSQREFERRDKDVRTSPTYEAMCAIHDIIEPRTKFLSWKPRT